MRGDVTLQRSLSLAGRIHKWSLHNCSHLLHGPCAFLPEEIRLMKCFHYHRYSIHFMAWWYTHVLIITEMYTRLPSTHFTKGLWAHNCNLVKKSIGSNFYFDDRIRSHFCTCHDSWAVVHVQTCDMIGSFFAYQLHMILQKLDHMLISPLWNGLLMSCLNWCHKFKCKQPHVDKA